MRRLRLFTGWGGAVILPLATLWLLLAGGAPDPQWQHAKFHFVIVSATALIALVLALLMVRAATQVRDTRVLFLALGFLCIAGIFLVHALTTPGALVAGANPWVGFSARASLLAGAVCFALGTVPWSAAMQERIVARQRLVIGCVAALLVLYGVVAMQDVLRASDTAPATGTAAVHDDGGYGGYGGYGAPAATPATFAHPFEFLEDPTLGTVVTVVTLALFAVVVARYSLIYRALPSPLVAAFLVSGIFLFQSQISMVAAPVWHASWWEYHLLMLMAFIAAVIGLVVEYGRAGSVQGVVEGLLFRDTIVQVQRGYTEVIVALVEAMEAKDPYTRGHTQRVAELAVRIGQELRLGPERLRILNRAALLHDIGKIGVPDSILNKPAKLTEEEYAVVKEHPVRGYAMIKHVKSLQQELGGVRHHHERLDGSGYPDGLKGDAIPLGARIIAVADVYDALTSPRPYRDAWPRERALALIDSEAGSKLDPTCVRALHAVLRHAPAPRSAAQPAMAAAS